MATNDIFPKALRHYRTLAAMSQEALASAAALDRTYVSQLERGRKSPTLTTLAKLADCLGTTVQRLLREPVSNIPVVPQDYLVRNRTQVTIARKRGGHQAEAVAISTDPLLAAVNTAHALIDDLYSAELDVAAILAGRPRIAAVFYASDLAGADWGEVVTPSAGDGRTTSVSIMARSGIRKLYEGWLCVLSNGGYREFLNRRNRSDLIA